MTLADVRPGWRVSALAWDIANRAHRSHARKFTDEPYIEHPMRVAKAVRLAGGDDDTYAAALLHDVVEDCGISIAALNACGIPTSVTDIVDRVTRRPGETYVEFVARAAADPRSWLLKRADVLDNLATLPPGHGLHRRYVKALAILGDAAETV